MFMQYTVWPTSVITDLNYKMYQTSKETYQLTQKALYGEELPQNSFHQTTVLSFVLVFM